MDADGVRTGFDSALRDSVAGIERVWTAACEFVKELGCIAKLWQMEQGRVC